MGNPNDALIVFATYLAFAPSAYLAPWKGWALWAHFAAHLLHRLWVCYETLRAKAKVAVTASQHPVYERVEENFLEFAFVVPLLVQSVGGFFLIAVAIAKGTFKPEPKRALMWAAPDLLIAFSLISLITAASSQSG